MKIIYSAKKKGSDGTVSGQMSLKSSLLQFIKYLLNQMGKEFKFFILVLLVFAASPFNNPGYLTQEAHSESNTLNYHGQMQAETYRLLQSGDGSFPLLTQDQSFNSQDIKTGQNLNFGTFQEQASTNQAPATQQSNTQNNGEQKQQEITQTKPQISGNTSLDSSLVPAKKEQPKIFLSQVHKAVLGKGLKINQGISYQRLHIGQLQKKFLFIDFILAEKDKWQKVNITITFQGSEQKLIDCKYDGHDSCYIPNQKLKAKSILFLYIKCQDECTYNFNSHWSDLEHLQPGSSYVFTFGKETFQLYHVQLKDKNFQEFRVHVAPRATLKPFENIKIYGKYGSDTGITTTEYDFKSMSLWQDGQILFLFPREIQDTKFDLLLVGQTDSTYEIICELITQFDHTIEDGQRIYEYLKANSSKSYHIASFDTKRFSEFSLKVSVLTGNLEVEYFYDRNLQKPLPYEPFKYMDDSEYIFEATQIASIASQGLYVKISSQSSMQGQRVRDATYTINYEGRQKSDAIELHQHVYGFVTYEQSKFAYFKFKRLQQVTQVNINFTVSVLQVLAKAKIQFLVCKDKLHVCTNPQKYKTVTDPISRSEPKSEISQKEKYQFQIDAKYLEKINNLEQEGTIVVKMTRQGDTIKDAKGNIAYGLLALQFINNNKILILREGRPLQDKLAANEMKIYKYVNSDQNVKEIRIHLNEIAGIIKLSGAIKDPYEQRVINVQPEGTTLRFKNNLTSPILVSVRAEQKAIFGISMQIILKDDNTGIADVRAIGQDLAYTVRINPNSYTIFQITPMFYQFQFKYESSQSIIVCPIDVSTSECINVNSQVNSTSLQNDIKPTQKGELTKGFLSKQRKARVKITNPFSNSAAQVTVIFHSRIFDHCEPKKIGTAYSQNVKNGSCFNYLLQGQENTGLQMYISKRQLANMSYSVLICGNSVQDVFKLKTLGLTPKLISDQCQNSLQAKKISIYWYVNTNNAGIRDLTVKVDFVVQKTGGLVVLPEGLTYSVLTKARDGALKIFGYNLINIIDTRIYIHQVIGRFKAFAKIIREEDRETETVSQINYHVNSVRAMSYEQEPIIVIPQKMIEEVKCQKRCFLLIAVTTDSEQGRTVEFQIQVYQRFRNLNDDSSIKEYLEAGSTAYYTYRAKEAALKQNTLIFFLSDHHQKCANLYIHFLQNPGPKFSLASAFESNQLFYKHKGPETKYFIAVQAVKTCDYTLSVLQYDTSIHRLQRGKQSMLKLAKGQVRYFTFEVYTQQPFKILSLSKFGEIGLHLNASSNEVDHKTFTTDELDFKKFEMSSQNPNALAVSKSDKIYCKNCSYLLAAEAISTSFATLFLVYPSTIVPIYKNKFFSDYILKKGESTLASYNSLEKSKIQVVVHSGSVQVTAIYKDYRSSQTFSAKSDIQTMNIEISQDIIKENSPRKQAGKDVKDVDAYYQQMKTTAIIYEEKIPINFVIKALSDKSSYTLQIKSLPSKGDLSGYSQYQNIKAGQPNHIQVSNQKVLCLNGDIGRDQEILLATNSDNQEKLKKISFNAKMRNSTVPKIKTQILKNIIVIKLIQQDTKEIPIHGVSSYEVCLKLDTAQEQQQEQKKEEKKTEEEKKQILKEQQQKNITETEALQTFDDEDRVVFKAVVTQANSVNIIPSDTETIVRGTNTYVVHSDGEFILDVFECKGNAKVSYSDSLASLRSSKPKLLESVGISEQKHAVKVSQNDTTFINVTSQHALIRWLPLIIQTDQGSGYLKFQAGDIRYNSKFKYINVEYQPLQLKKKTKSKVSEVRYTLFVTNDSQILDYASQCSPDSSDKIVEINFEFPYEANAQAQKQYRTHSIEKNFLQSRFNGSENIYFTLIAKLVLQISNASQVNPKFQTSISDSHQHYRFIYNRQQLLLQTYKPSTIESIPYGFLGLIVGSILLILVVMTFLFTRKIAPWIARLRSRHLVEDNDPGQNKQDLEAVPPSSDRNQRAPENALQTQEKMKS